MSWKKRKYQPDLKVFIFDLNFSINAVLTRWFKYELRTTNYNKNIWVLRIQKTLTRLADYLLNEWVNNKSTKSKRKIKCNIGISAERAISNTPNGIQRFRSFLTAQEKDFLKTTLKKIINCIYKKNQIKTKLLFNLVLFFGSNSIKTCICKKTLLRSGLTFRKTLRRKVRLLINLANTFIF